MRPTIAAAVVCLASLSCAERASIEVLPRQSTNSAESVGAGGTPAPRVQPGGISLGTDDSQATSPTGDFLSCLGETRQAEVVGLDLFVMLDASASMLEPLPGPAGSTPPSKWQAVRDSLIRFIESDATADIGIGLQYFPLFTPAVPATCSTNEDCGAGGPCSNSTCLTPVAVDRQQTVLVLESDTRVTCSEDSECGGGDVCRNWIGECVFPPGSVEGFPTGVRLSDILGFPIDPLCATDDDCRQLTGTSCEPTGSCASSPSTQCTEQTFQCAGGEPCSLFLDTCLNRTQCDADTYASPSVEIRRDPDRLMDIYESLYARVPEGVTPTGPALTGALQHAQSWAVEHPGRQTVTVFATDGLPTECSPTAPTPIAAIAQAAEQGSPSVPTFVIGVFGTRSTDRESQGTLDQIASAGGTRRALMVRTDGNLNEEFFSALEGIRDTAVSCDFQLTTGGVLDLDKVNLSVTSRDGVQTALQNVSTADRCADTDGWFYRRDRQGTPTQIRVCPRTCESLTSRGAKADLQVGCPTVLR